MQPVVPAPAVAAARQPARRHYQRLLLASVGTLLVAFAAQWFTQARSRTFTLTAKELELPEHLGPFDNGPLLRRIEAVVRDPVTLSPCHVTSAATPAANVAGDDTVAAPDEPAPLEPRNKCLLIPHSLDQPVAIGARAPRAIRSLELSTEPSKRGAAAESCPIVLRADASNREVNALALSWFAPGEACKAEATLWLAQPERVQLLSMSLADDPVQGLLSKDPTQLKLPLAQGRPVRLTLEDREVVTLWELDQKLSSLSLRLASPQTFSYAVTPVPGPQYTCEAGLAGKVKFTTDATSPLTLSIVRLTRDGLEVSITVPGDFVLDTGACELASYEVRWLSWLMLMLSCLSACGLLTWVGEKVLGK